MTLNDMILELFDNLGRPTDLSPLDKWNDYSTLNPELQGYIQLKNWINQGYNAIATWRTPQGQFFRQNDMIDRKYIQWGPHLIVGDHTVTTDGSILGYDNTQHVLQFLSDSYYDGNIPPSTVLVGLNTLGDHLLYEDVDPNLQYDQLSDSLEYQQVYKAIDADWVSLAYFTDSKTLYTLKPLPWVVDETQITIYERGINWSRMSSIGALDDLYAIRQFRVIDEKTDMELAPRTENFTQNLSEVGIPSQYFREGRYVYFDRHVPDTPFTLQLEYYRQPIPLSDGNESPVIQTRYHPPIVMWASYRGLLRQGENTDAYSMKGFLVDEMKSIIKEDDLDIERLEGNFRGGFNSGGGFSYGG